MPYDVDGHTLHFPHRYCQLYLNNRNDFSDRAWRDDTRRCL